MTDWTSDNQPKPNYLIVEYVAVGRDVLEVYEDGSEWAFATHSDEAHAQAMANDLNKRLIERRGQQE